MKEIRDKKKRDHYFAEQSLHFGQKPESLKLLQFEKGELLNGPEHPLTGFYIVVKGSISIYYITEDGSVRPVSKAGPGILLGDMEFSGVEGETNYTEAAETVICLAIPFQENRCLLENDAAFLRFVVAQLAEKLSLSSRMDVVTQTLEEKLMFYLSCVEPEHEISSISQALQVLHCSRRQLQRVLKNMCEKEVLIKKGRGRYRLK